MTQYKQLVAPRFGAVAVPGACLVYAQNFYGAPAMYDSAWQAGQATRHKHYNRNFPDGAILWFEHWGTYYKWSKGRYEYDNFGHVVIFKRGLGYYSSPTSGGMGRWIGRTLRDVEIAFGCVYKFWSEDINGVRVLQPVKTSGGGGKPAAPAKKGTIVKQHVQRKDHRAKKGRSLAPGKTLYLFEGNGRDSNATNVAGGIGYADFITHLYASGGVHGEGVDLVLVWISPDGKKQSRHYVERAHFGKAGTINANTPFKRQVKKGEKVYLLAVAPSTNTKPVTIGLLNTDMYLYDS